MSFNQKNLYKEDKNVWIVTIKKSMVKIECDILDSPKNIYKED